MKVLRPPRRELHILTGPEHDIQPTAKLVQMTSTALPVPQDASVLGARIRDGGCSFGLWAPGRPE
jgi:hypothetical protein